jgi:hypothetical protein
MISSVALPVVIYCELVYFSTEAFALFIYMFPTTEVLSYRPMQAITTEVALATLHFPTLFWSRGDGERCGGIASDAGTIIE